MKYTTAMVLASAAAVSADCSVTSFEEGGNWYCQAVSLIKYTGLDTTGSYSAVKSMDATTGDCTFEDQAYSGAIAPFDGEVRRIPCETARVDTDMPLALRPHSWSYSIEAVRCLHP